MNKTDQHNTEEVKQTIRALHVAIGRMDTAVRHLDDYPDGYEKDPDLSQMIAESGRDAASLAIDLISDLPGQIGVDVTNEGPGFGNESSFGYAYRALLKKHM